MNAHPFSSLPSAASRKIAMQHGDVLFQQDQPTSGLYRVCSGRVKLRRTGLNGEPITLHIAPTESYFAEASIFSEVYHCDAVCLQEGSVEKISKPAILSALKSDQDFNLQFMRMLATQVQQYRAHIELLTIRPAKERVFAGVQAGYLTSTIPEFASRINLTHEVCYRSLRQLCDENRMIRKSRGRYALI